MTTTIVMLSVFFALNIVDAIAADQERAEQECWILSNEPELRNLVVKISSPDGKAVTAGTQMQCSSQEIFIPGIKIPKLLIEVFDGAIQENTLLWYEVIETGASKNLFASVSGSGQDLRIALAELAQNANVARRDPKKQQEIIAGRKTLKVVPRSIAAHRGVGGDPIDAKAKPATDAEKKEKSVDGTPGIGSFGSPEDRKTDRTIKTETPQTQEVSAQVQQTGTLSRTIVFRLPENIVNKLKADFIATAPESESKIARDNGKVFAMGTVTISFQTGTVIIKEDDQDGGDKLRRDFFSEKENAEQSEKFLKALLAYLETTELTDTTTVEPNDGYWSIAQRLSDDPGEFTSGEYQAQLEMLNGPMWVEEEGVKKATLHPGNEVKYLKKTHTTSEEVSQNAAALHTEKQNLKEDLDDALKKLQATEEDLQKLRKKLSETQEKLTKASTACLSTPSQDGQGQQPQRDDTLPQSNTFGNVVSETPTVDAPPAEPAADPTRIPVIDPLNNWIAQNVFMRRAPLMFACLPFLLIILFVLKRQFASDDDTDTVKTQQEKIRRLEKNYEKSEKTRESLQKKIGDMTRDTGHETRILVEKVEQLQETKRKLEADLQASERERTKIIVDLNEARRKNTNLSNERDALKQEAPILSDIIKMESQNNDVEGCTNPGFYRIQAQNAEANKNALLDENLRLIEELRQANTKKITAERRAEVAKSQEAVAEIRAKSAEEKVAAAEQGRLETLVTSEKTISELTQRVEETEKKLRKALCDYEELTAALARNATIETAVPTAAHQEIAPPLPPEDAEDHVADLPEFFHEVQELGAEIANDSKEGGEESSKKPEKDARTAINFWERRQAAFNRDGKAEEPTLGVRLGESPKENTHVEVIHLQSGPQQIRFFSAENGTREETFLCPHCGERVPFHEMPAVKRHVDPETGNCASLKNRRSATNVAS